MSNSEDEMEFFGCVEDMCFASEDLIGFPAVKAKLWPAVLEKAKATADGIEDDDERESLHERIDAMHTLSTARSLGGAPAAKVFRQVNEDLIRSEMSAALNELLPGQISRMWGKRDFHGLAACYGKSFYSMQASDSTLIKKMPVVFLAGLLQVMSNDRASLSSNWWKDDKQCLRNIAQGIKMTTGGRFRKGEKSYINSFAKVFVAGIALLHCYYEEPYSWRAMDMVVKGLSDVDPLENLVDAGVVKDVLPHLKSVHPLLYEQVTYALSLHEKIAEIKTVKKGKVKDLQDYAMKENGRLFVGCLLSMAKDIAFMLQEIGSMFEKVELNGHFQHTVGFFEAADEKEMEKTKYSTAYGRAVLLCVPLTFPHLIEEECDTAMLVKALLDRLPPGTGFGKPPKKKRRKKGETSPPLSPATEEQIMEIFGSETEDEEDEANGES